MLAVRDRRGRLLSVVTGGQAVAWVAELGSLVALVTVGAVVASPSLRWPSVLVVILGSLAMVLPDSEAGLLTLLGFGGWWLVAERSASWVAVFVAAVAGLVFHLSLAHAAAAPSGARTQPAVMVSSVLRAGLVALATGITVATVAGLERSGERAPAFMIGAALVLVGLIPWAASLRGHRG